MADPHAKYEDGRIWWRGSNPEFRDMDALSARNLLEALSTADWSSFGEDQRMALVADLRGAIERYDDHTHSMEAADAA